MHFNFSSCSGLPSGEDGIKQSELTENLVNFSDIQRAGKKKRKENEERGIDRVDPVAQNNHVIFQ